MIEVFLGLSLFSQVTYLIGMFLCWIVAVGGALKIMREKVVTPRFVMRSAKRSDVIKHFALFFFAGFVPGGNILLGGLCIIVAVSESEWWNKPL